MCGSRLACPISFLSEGPLWILFNVSLGHVEIFRETFMSPLGLMGY